MADSEKPTPKKVSDKEPNQVIGSKVQLKPSSKKVLGQSSLVTSPVKCVCNETSKIWPRYCFVCSKFVSKAKTLRDELIAATQADIEDDVDEILDSNEEHVPKKSKKEAVEKPHVHYPLQHVCVYKWGQITVGQKYKAMSVGQESRSRTGLVLVPIE